MESFRYLQDTDIVSDIVRRPQQSQREACLSW